MGIHLAILYMIFSANLLGSLVSARQIGDRIVNGQDATQGQFPYQVSWCFDNDVYCFNFCGGSIFTETAIITAAHCCDAIGKPEFTNQDNEIIDWSDTKIVAGELELLFDSGLEQVRKIKSHVIHPFYDTSNFPTYQHDICLLTLDSPLEFNENVNRIYLDEDDSVVDTKCTVSGWGALESDGTHASPYLQWTEVMIKSDDECSKVFPNNNVYDSLTMICASAPETGSCKGDSGGPLTCNGRLTGVVSFGVKNDCAGYPNYYTKIQYYKDWIESSLEPEETTTEKLTTPQETTTQQQTTPKETTIENQTTQKETTIENQTTPKETSTEKQTTPSSASVFTLNIGIIFITLTFTT